MQTHVHKISLVSHFYFFIPRPLVGHLLQCAEKKPIFPLYRRRFLLALFRFNGMIFKCYTHFRHDYLIKLEINQLQLKPSANTQCIVSYDGAAR